MKQDIPKLVACACLAALICFTNHHAYAQHKREAVSIIPVDSGWANNSVNATVFRKNSLVTFHNTQYIAYYNAQQYVVLGKRKSGARQWQLQRTPYQGNASDAHNVISIMIDGEGYLHLSWDHHNNPLRYCRSVRPGSLELTGKLPMTGQAEDQVSYPEFYRMPRGDLLFFYRDGGSGRGNLVINHYNVHTKQWTQLHRNLIDGEGRRNAYWQACIDQRGTIHLSWVWRESPDVASNHDMCYARSADGGVTWTKSTGEQYTLPVNAATAEYALTIPQNSGLINQTAMFADAGGHPYIATYWREPGSAIPQYHLIYTANGHWQQQSLGFRTTAFSLSGMGTRRIPISRPQVVAKQSGNVIAVALIFRDAERNDVVSVAISNNISKGKWKVEDLLEKQVGAWEPSYDMELWKEKGILNIFIESVEQVDAEGKANIPPQAIQVLEWTPWKK